MRRVFVFCLILYLVNLTCQSVEAADSPGLFLSAAQVEADVKLARDAYSRMHPGYARYTNEATLAEAWQSIIDRANTDSGMSVQDLYLDIQSVLTLIRCDHTKAELPKVLQEQRKTNPFYLPARLDVVERRGFVRIAGEGSSLHIEDEILSIDGRDFSEVLAAVEVFVPYDGKTIWSRNSGLSESLEFMGGAIDHFGGMLWPIKDLVDLTVRRKLADGSFQTLELSVDRINFKQWSALNDVTADSSESLATSSQKNEGLSQATDDLVQSLNLPLTTAENFENALVFRRIGDKAAYLRVDTFVNYRNPVSPLDLYQPVFEAIKNEKRDTLILDLRLNGGGSTDAQRGLLEHLIQKSVRPVKDMRVATLDFADLREHLWTWDKRALKPNRLGFSRNKDGSYSLRRFVSDEYKKAKPAKYNFDGNLIALISNSNSSGTTNLLSVLREQRPVALIGQATGGSAEGVTAGLLFTLTLPESGIAGRIPFFHTYNNVSDFTPGLGLKPDIKVVLKADEWSIGYDPVLDVALRQLDWVSSDL